MKIHFNIESLPMIAKFNRSILRNDINMTDLTFERAVTDAREMSSDRILSNRSISHARHVILELFHLAIQTEADVLLCAGWFDPDCYDSSIVEKAKQLLDQGQSIHGIAENTKPEILADSPFAKMLADPKNTNSSLSVVDPKKIAGGFLHFTLAGDNAYRFEEDHKLATALLSFNRPTTVSILKDEFDFFKSSSTQLSDVAPSKKS
jgi:hypothetical protein